MSPLIKSITCITIRCKEVNGFIKRVAMEACCVSEEYAGLGGGGRQGGEAYGVVVESDEALGVVG